METTRREVGVRSARRVAARIKSDDAVESGLEVDGVDKLREAASMCSRCMRLQEKETTRRDRVGLVSFPIFIFLLEFPVLLVLTNSFFLGGR